jgi:acyl carrier protein
VTTTEPDDLDARVRQALEDVAPDLDSATIARDADFHDDLGLDSMDSLNLAIALEERTGVTVPERDYPKVHSIETCVAYLRARAAEGRGGGA